MTGLTWNVEYGNMKRRHYLAEARLEYQNASATLAYVRKHASSFFPYDLIRAQAIVLNALDKVWQLQNLVAADMREAN